MESPERESAGLTILRMALYLATGALNTLFGAALWFFAPLAPGIYPGTAEPPPPELIISCSTLSVILHAASWGFFAAMIRKRPPLPRVLRNSAGLPLISFLALCCLHAPPRYHAIQRAARGMDGA
jgi:hypothetical protein